MAPKAITMEELEISDIQGILIRGHSDLPFANYLMINITDSQKAKEWLQVTVDKITNGKSKDEDFRLQIAFTYPGLLKLDWGGRYGFSVEFIQGMTTDYRQRLLGDLEESCPLHWEWGGLENPEIHILFMLFAKNEAILSDQLKKIKDELAEFNLSLIHILDGNLNQAGKEHFGFRDGMSQPLLKGLSKKGIPENTLENGEFILGYRNGYGQLPETPLIPPGIDKNGLLPHAQNCPEYKDFGKNGSYMVFRQLEQNVSSFWNQVKEAAESTGETDCIFIASKMVGRWPNGTPVSQAPTEEKPFKNDNSYFLYRKEDDLEGFKCPLGSHIRRANPRDVLPDNNAKSSVKISNYHRILRRGRNYGKPLVESYEPGEILFAKDDGEKRGLHFICFNTNISRQFEFVQHMWCNNTKFAGLYNDPDPLLGVTDERSKEETHDFTIQAKPVRKKVHGLKRHVKVVGGAYFFTPGIRAIRFLANN